MKSIDTKLNKIKNSKTKVSEIELKRTIDSIESQQNLTSQLKTKKNPKTRTSTQYEKRIKSFLCGIVCIIIWYLIFITAIILTFFLTEEGKERNLSLNESNNFMNITNSSNGYDLTITIPTYMDSNISLTVNNNDNDKLSTSYSSTELNEIILSTNQSDVLDNNNLSLTIINNNDTTISYSSTELNEIILPINKSDVLDNNNYDNGNVYFYDDVDDDYIIYYDDDDDDYLYIDYDYESSGETISYFADNDNTNNKSNYTSKIKDVLISSNISHNISLIKTKRKVQRDNNLIFDDIYSKKKILPFNITTNNVYPIKSNIVFFNVEKKLDTKIYYNLICFNNDDKILYESYAQNMTDIFNNISRKDIGYQGINKRKKYRSDDDLQISCISSDFNFSTSPDFEYCFNRNGSRYWGYDTNRPCIVFTYYNSGMNIENTNKKLQNRTLLIIVPLAVAVIRKDELYNYKCNIKYGHVTLPFTYMFTIINSNKCSN